MLSFIVTGAPVQFACGYAAIAASGAFTLAARRLGAIRRTRGCVRRSSALVATPSGTTPCVT